MSLYFVSQLYHNARSVALPIYFTMSG